MKACELWAEDMVRVDVDVASVLGFGVFTKDAKAHTGRLHRLTVAQKRHP